MIQPREDISLNLITGIGTSYRSHYSVIKLDNEKRTLYLEAKGKKGKKQKEKKDEWIIKYQKNYNVNRDRLYSPTVIKHVLYYVSIVAWQLVKVKREIIVTELYCNPFVTPIPVPQTSLRYVNIHRHLPPPSLPPPSPTNIPFQLKYLFESIEAIKEF